jgi:ribose/xylose/arabinose/galactoside ABC-type transport system permease subunit
MIAGALGVAVVGALVAAWWVGLVAGVLVALVAVVPRTRFLVTLGAPVALALSGLYVVVQQYRYDYPSNLDWPQQFARIDQLVWLAVILLLADVVIGWLRQGTSEGTSEES